MAATNAAHAAHATSIDALVKEVTRVNGNADPEELTQLQEQLEQLRISDLIRIVERTNANRGAMVMRLLNRARFLAVFDALDPNHQADIVQALGSEATAEYFDQLGPEDRAQLLDELPAEIAEEMLLALDPDEKDATFTVLGYEKGTVGRYMSPEVPDIYPEYTVDEALTLLREIADEVETIYTLPVVEHDRKLVGVTSLKRLFTAQGSQTVGELIDDPVFAYATDDAEETVRWFLPLDLLAMPVVDESDRLVGMFTFDDAHDIQEREDSEDSARSGASEPLNRPYLSTPVLALVRSRIVWLAVLAVSALLTVQVLDTFESTLEKAVVLSLFIPLLTGTGGNTGNQAATTVTRSLALGDVRRRDIAQVMWREVRVGLVLGTALGVAGFLLAWAVYGLPIGIVIGSTLVLVCTMSATVGGAMPIIAKTVGADPAVFSNPFITTFCDAAGLIIYFLIAKSVLGL
ncbi:magnesium transporter [Corynebacterium cystitidis]|uniref:Magnesium transporter MgtE n=1 Tax=Corynebacterium cystitidis DSM 20524 TaxID=1121357 RepID=A0A1H9U7E9_9CORY|nr:magnesium transporter [Corynebacterium cystitidis]WJY81208.1 Magnesium transporter MgtE [Corynebacterium cystitidis DSM 20524]SES05158.1 magnesium transporter [Corynebacterium cystitidis DSM 20524]SNV89414.1 Mg/Co/Ni transporter [Corynebacterium cystitidis]